MFIFDLLIGFINFITALLSLWPLWVALLIFIVIYSLRRSSSNEEQESSYSNSWRSEEPITLNTTENSYSSYSTSKPQALSFDYPSYEQISRFHVYKIKGKNPQTNRQKTETIVLKEDTSAEIIAQKTYLLPPYEISIDSNARTERPASEAQLKFAKELNIPIPTSCSVEDLHLLISRKQEELEADYITPELLEMVGKNGICLSPYSSPEDGIKAMLHSGDVKQRLTFFSYFVYCVSHGIWHITTPEHSKYKKVFEEFGDTFLSDASLLEAIRSLTYDHIWFWRSHGAPDKRSKKTTQAFLTATEFLEANIPTQTLNGWEDWKADHGSTEQIQRQWRSYAKRLSPIEISTDSCQGIFQGTSERYITSLSKCTCPDFMKRHKPCKHMYRLAYELRNNN